MRKTKISFTIITLLAGAISGYAQGELNFNFYNAGENQVRQSIWNTQSLAASTYAVTYGGQTVYEEIGSTSSPIENPKGNTIYSGPGLSGTGYDVQLLAGPAGITTVGGTSSANGANNVGLTPVSSIFHFHTAAAILGYMFGAQQVTLPTESYFAAGDQISLAVASWNNQGGTVNTLAAAIASGGSAPWGISPVVATAYAGGLPVSTPAQLPTALESFSLGVSPLPEPGIIALGVMGAVGFLFRRWR